MGAKALLLAVLVGAWWWWEQGGSGRTGGEPKPIDPAVNGRAAEVKTLPSAAPHEPLAALLSASASISARAAAPARAEAPPVAVELCGVGQIVAEKEPPHLFAHAEAAAWPRVVAALERSPAERARAAALVLRIGRLVSDSLSVSNVDPREALALMAVNSPDPAIFRWAWALCQYRDAPQACTRLSAQSLVERLPADAAHWLLLAQAEPLELQQALRGVVLASEFSAWPSLTPWVESALPPDLAPYLGNILLGQAMRSDMALEAVMNAGVVSLARVCRAPEAERSLCLALAGALDHGAPDLLGLHLAGRIGEVHGWPKQRVSAIQQRIEQLQQASDLGPVGGSAWGCANVERNRRFIRDRATHGEAEALRRLAAASAPAAAPR